MRCGYFSRNDCTPCLRRIFTSRGVSAVVQVRRALSQSDLDFRKKMAGRRSNCLNSSITSPNRTLAQFLPLFRRPSPRNFLTFGRRPLFPDSGESSPSGKRKSMFSGTGLWSERTTRMGVLRILNSQLQISGALDMVAERSRSLTLEGR